MRQWARREDERLLTGGGRYVADMAVPGCLDAAFVRSTVPRGVLREVDCSAARKVAGVVGAWSAADLPEVPYTLLARLATEEAATGRERPVLVRDRVRYPGEAVAVVAGEDRSRAEDGAAEVAVRIDPLPAVVTPSAAAQDSVRLFDDLSNVVFEDAAGEPIGDSVWREAAAVVEARYRQQPAVKITLMVNDEAYPLDVEPRRILADALREDCGLTGTHLGCEHGVCGACTVLADGKAVRSCLMLAVQCDGRSVRTVEGLAGSDGEPHPLQRAFSAEYALQRGFRTPGFLMVAAGALAAGSMIDPHRIDDLVESNICRCTGYEPIRRAITRLAADAPPTGQISPDTT